MTAVTAHRGYCKAAPENSLAAFQAAIDVGAEWIELDLQATKDGTVIVFHDTHLGRLGRSDLVVTQQEWPDLRRWDIAPLAGCELSDEFEIPTLSEVLQLARGNVRLNLELKLASRHADPGRLVDLVCRVVERDGDGVECTLTSFNYGFCRVAGSCGLPFGPALDADGEVPAGARVVSVSHKILNEELIARVHQAGCDLHVWTVNEEKKLRDLLLIGVDNVITDEAVAALRLRDELA